MTEKDFDKLRAKLPKGYAEILHQRTGFTESAIYKTLVGSFKNPNPVIIQSAIELAQETANKNNDLVNQINSL